MKTQLKDNPRILICNDDGIDAPGIKILENVARTFSDDIWVVAPDIEKSGAGRSVSITNIIRARKRDARHFQINGSPTDCVLMAWFEFIEGKKPDVLLSGVNSGANLAEDVSYSGTIAAAMEATLLGIPAIALSQLRPLDRVADFSPAEKFAPVLIEKLLNLDKWPKDSFININFPGIPVADISGIKITHQGQRPPGTFSTESRTDPRMQAYYWIKMSYGEGIKAEGSDLAAIAENAISVTPIKMDFTNYEWQTDLQKVFQAG